MRWLSLSTCVGGFASLIVVAKSCGRVKTHYTNCCRPCTCQCDVDMMSILLIILTFRGLLQGCTFLDFYNSRAQAQLNYIHNMGSYR